MPPHAFGASSVGVAEESEQIGYLPLGEDGQVWVGLVAEHGVDLVEGLDECCPEFM